MLRYERGEACVRTPRLDLLRQSKSHGRDNIMNLEDLKKIADNVVQLRREAKAMDTVPLRILVEGEEETPGVKALRANIRKGVKKRETQSKAEVLRIIKNGEGRW
jgi:hypothetical protein